MVVYTRRHKYRRDKFRHGSHTYSRESSTSKSKEPRCTANRRYFFISALSSSFFPFTRRLCDTAIYYSICFYIPFFVQANVNTCMLQNRTKGRKLTFECILFGSFLLSFFLSWFYFPMPQFAN